MILIDRLTLCLLEVCHQVVFLFMIGKHHSPPTDCMLQPGLRACCQIPPPCTDPRTNSFWGFSRCRSCCCGSEQREEWKPGVYKSPCSVTNQRYFSPLVDSLVTFCALVPWAPAGSGDCHDPTTPRV